MMGTVPESRSLVPVHPQNNAGQVDDKGLPPPLSISYPDSPRDRDLPCVQEGVSLGHVPGQSVTHFPNGLLEIQKTNRETGLLKISAAQAPVSGRLSWSIPSSPQSGGGGGQGLEIEGLVQRFSLTSLEHLESKPT